MGLAECKEFGPRSLRKITKSEKAVSCVSRPFASFVIQTPGEAKKGNIDLADYYVDTRYPDTVIFATAFTQDEAKAAVADAETMLGFVRPRIEALLNGD